MNIKKAISLLESLAQENRLTAFRILVKAGLDGLAAGEISKKMNAPQNTISFHLSHLEKSGLIKSKKQSRYIIYSANFDMVEKLMKFLLESCCFDSKNKCHIATNFIHLFQGNKNEKC